MYTNESLAALFSYRDGTGPKNFCNVGNLYNSDAFSSRIKLFPVGLCFFTKELVSIPGDVCEGGISRKKIIAFPAAVGLRPANDTHLLFYPQLLIPHTCRWSRWFVWSGNSNLYSQEALFSSYRVCPRQ